MKKSFDLPELLMRDVNKLARERGTSARAIVQEALVRALAEHKEGFTLKNASTAGWHSMRPKLRGRSLRDLVRMSYDAPTATSADSPS